MPSDTEIIERFGHVEGRLSVIETTIINGARQIEKFEGTIEKLEKKLDDFTKWFRAVAISIFGGLFVFLIETIREILINK